jgi:hypothetical protein
VLKVSGARFRLAEPPGSGWWLSKPPTGGQMLAVVEGGQGGWVGREWSGEWSGE